MALTLIDSNWISLLFPFIEMGLKEEKKSLREKINIYFNLKSKYVQIVH